MDEFIKAATFMGLLPDISERYVKDKSKTDHFAKVLVIAQASWLILQVIMRWASKLTVTALELNTLAHSICALLIYFLWWNKPLDIQDPTLLVGERLHPLVAFIRESDNVGGNNDNFYYKFGKNENEEKVVIRKYVQRMLECEGIVDLDVRTTNIRSQKSSEMEDRALGPEAKTLVGIVDCYRLKKEAGSVFLELRDGELHKKVVVLHEDESLHAILEMTKAGVLVKQKNSKKGRADPTLQRWRMIGAIENNYTEISELIDLSFLCYKIDAGNDFPTNLVVLRRLPIYKRGHWLADDTWNSETWRPKN